MAVRRGKIGKKKVAAKAVKVKEPVLKLDRPTPEMEARVRFEAEQITSETGQRLGFAYKRKPLIETMDAKGAFSPDEIAALRFYRTAFDRSERSPVKSCLNVSSGRNSGSASILYATPSMLYAKQKLRICESEMGRFRSTMRAVVLDDKSFSEIAIDRFGSRIDRSPSRTSKASRPGEGAGEKIRPKSGRHREIVRLEFKAGVTALTDTIRRMITTGAVEEVWVDPLPNGFATIRRSTIAPAGRYRCWGDNVLVDRVMSELVERYGAALDFKSADVAIAALKAVEDGRLRHLEPEELAA